ncbi:polysaccharide pyruvyl transferase family protein [Curtobacterium sp. AB451]|uniref:polysaccharide pyruvyl transferase family protein n=1 Tax=Curtobacterium sp. AB451 TaxID=3422306 RepID=UPI003D34D2F5
MENDYREDVLGVPVVRWNPEVDGGGRVDNFGDLLGPLVVRRLAPRARADDGGRSLLAIGSIMQFGQPGDVVWGSGLNAKLRTRRLDPRRLFDVRAVRGPFTAIALEAEGNGVPPVYGDPAILLPELFPDTVAFAALDRKRFDVVVVPNVNDTDLDAAGHHVIAPTGDPWQVIEQILSAEFVVGTSLHAIVIAEAYGVPARAVRSTSESVVKYFDYYEGTGRAGVTIAQTVEEAVALGGADPLHVSKGTALRDAFPTDLWTEEPVRTNQVVRHRSLGELVSVVTEQALSEGPAAEVDAWRQMARKLAVPVLRDRAVVLDDDELDSVMTDVRRLDHAGVLEGVDERWTRTRELAKYRLGDALRRSALVNDRGAQSVLDEVERAGEDGRLRMGGLLQLPDGGLDAFDTRLFLADDRLDGQRPVGDVTWEEVDPTLGTARWSAEVDIADTPTGTWVLVVHIDGPGGSRDVITKSAPTMAFPRWWHDGRPYRVDRTSRGNAVIHKESEAQ